MRSLIARLDRPVIALAAVAIIAGALRFYELSRPPEHVFDEVYYAKDACLYAGYPFRECGLFRPSEQSWVHPPLGKWTISLGEKAFGNDPFGWRFASAVFGTASVVAAAAIALLLFGKPLWAFVAGLLLATESLNFVQSRIAMLDIFLTFWVTVGFLFLVLDRRWIDRRSPPPADLMTPPVVPERGDVVGALEGKPTSPGPGAAAVEELSPVRAPGQKVPSPILRPWRLASGAAFGAACATKWSGLTALLGAWLLAFAWERTRRRRAEVRRPLWRAIQQESFGVVLALVLVPIVVYLGSYAGYFIEHGFHPAEFWRLQSSMAGYHLHLDPVEAATGKPIHPYLSEPWQWLLLSRPVAYYFKAPGTEILGIGNPAVFWVSLLTMPYLAYAWWGRREWEAGLVLVAVLAQYLPWFLSSRPQFLFYMTPVTPFLVLGATYLLRNLSVLGLGRRDSRILLPVVAGFVALSVAMFAFFWPVLVAFPLSREAWDLRMWFGSWV